MSDGRRAFWVFLILIAIAAYTWWNSPERTAIESRLTASTTPQTTTEPTPEGMLPPAAMLPPSPTLAPTATPIPANPSELSSLVWRFYHDLAGHDKAANKDLGSILSPAFLGTHDSTWTRDYGFIASPNVTITGVRGYAIDYAVDYDYDGQSGGKLHWRRSGTWVAAHGASGWTLNEDKWNAIHIVSVTYTNGTSQVVTDRAYADGRHVFDVPGSEVTFTQAKDGWRTSMVPLATPTPGLANEPPPEYYQPPSSGSYYAAPSSDCNEDSIQTVGDDGAILEMLSGVVYRVADYDTSTSSIWLTADDVLICGGRVVNKDENGEAVDAEKVR